MSIVVAVTRVAAQVAGGDQNITTNDLGGLTPQAALFIVTHATSDGVATAGAVLGVGAATGASNRWAVGIQSQDAVNPSNANRRGMTDECVVKLNSTAATVDGEADFVEFIENGITINWGDAPAAAYLLTVVFFAGTDLSVQASTFTFAAVRNATTDVNTVGFEPDALLLFSVGDNLSDTANVIALLSMGMAINKVADEQYALATCSVDNVSPTQVTAQITDDYGVAFCYTAGTLILAGEIGGYDADGFSCTTRLAAAGSNEKAGFLALNFGGAVDFEGGIIDSATDNGNQAITDPNFTPQAVIVCLNHCEAVDTAYTDGRAGSLGLGAFDTDEAYSNTVQDEDNSATSDTQSLSDDVCVNLPQHDGSAGHMASFVSFDATGWTWNFSATLGTAKKWLYLAVGVNNYTQSVAGALTSTGALTKQTGKPLAGVLTFVGALVKQMGGSLAGTFTSAGTLVKQTGKPLVGTLTSIGALVRQAGKPLAGALTPAGALARKTARTLAGTLTTAGSLTRKTARALAGAFTPTGALAKMAVRALAGTLTFVGTLALQTAKALSGTITFTGELIRRTSRALAGTFTPSGALIRKAMRMLAGEWAGSGVLARQIKKPFAGTLTTTGTLTRKIVKVLTGALSTAGVLSRKAKKILAGILSYIGALASRYPGLPVGQELEGSREFAVALLGSNASLGALTGERDLALALEGSRVIAETLAGNRELAIALTGLVPSEFNG